MANVQDMILEQLRNLNEKTSNVSMEVMCIRGQHYETSRQNPFRYG